MENNNPIENDQTAGNQTTLEDALFAIEIIRKALEFRPLIREAVLGEKYLNLPKVERQTEFLTPRVSFFFVDEARKIPSLFFRFVGDETPLVEMFFYPFESVLLFIDEAKKLVTEHFTNCDEKEKENVILEFSFEMTLLLFDSFYRRAEIAMDYFPLEVIGQWHRNKHLELFHNKSEQGEKVKLYKHPFLDKILNSYRKELSQFWKYKGKSSDDLRKLALAEEYDILLKHWRLLLKMSSDESIDWRDYAKAGKFNDTPDDLINNLLDVDRTSDETTNSKISEIALEHAARRVGLVKRSGVREYARNKRKEGIKISDYSSAQLFNCLQEGRIILKRVKENEKFIAQIENEPSFEQISDSALEKKRKLLEQKLEFVQEKLDEKLEQKAKSALIENS